jgi:hypothetical protein
MTRLRIILGCRQAWVATEPSNSPARQLYAAVGGKESPEPSVMVEFRLMAEEREPDPGPAVL